MALTAIQSFRIRSSARRLKRGGSRSCSGISRSGGGQKEERWKDEARLSQTLSNHRTPTSTDSMIPLNWALFWHIAREGCTEIQTSTLFGRCLTSLATTQICSFYSPSNNSSLKWGWTEWQSLYWLVQTWLFQWGWTERQSLQWLVQTRLFQWGWTERQSLHWLVQTRLFLSGMALGAPRIRVQNNTHAKWSVRQTSLCTQLYSPSTTHSSPILEPKPAQTISVSWQSQLTTNLLQLTMGQSRLTNSSLPITAHQFTTCQSHSPTHPLPITAPQFTTCQSQLTNSPPVNHSSPIHPLPITAHQFTHLPITNSPSAICALREEVTRVLDGRCCRCSTSCLPTVCTRNSRMFSPLKQWTQPVVMEQTKFPHQNCLQKVQKVYWTFHTACACVRVWGGTVWQGGGKGTEGRTHPPLVMVTR